MEQVDIFEIIKIVLAMLAAIFTYLMFFYEGKHKKRIEFDIDFHNLGLKNSDRIIEIGALAENKGYVEHKFESIRLRIRGINKDSKLTELTKNKPRLTFPENHKKVFPENDIKICKGEGGKPCHINIKNASKHEEKFCLQDPSKICLGDPNKIEMINKKYERYFVRPGIKQRFPIVLKIDKDWTHILVRVTFKYKRTKNVHVTERAFQIKDET